ncbi:hypothetical protein Pst134EA_017144 [Puccinia striiformis f. sp. tritici]|uniref:hypothetical protein n=1 Tax=Puccinia striiformis f. sp. tritici TaxID=168172 RepID=UPI00200773C9|nr:hypothetical protein Pst134EA_017144 [Puccinia striiformis f. sp. tritici]KAH9460828.1 hypothetical protein Pst134EA_017144 [Puccinia striiformis f. sp. tritici]
MLDPNYALFTGSAADSKTYQPNRASAVNPNHLGSLMFCGRVIGKALYEGPVVDTYFTLAFYKHLLEHLHRGGYIAGVNTFGYNPNFGNSRFEPAWRPPQRM